MLALVAGFRDETASRAAWDRVQTMIQSGDAILIEDLQARGVDGKFIISGTVEHMSYPSDFSPPNLPDKMPAEKALETLKAWPAIAIVPTAFAVRDVGQTLNAAVRVDADGKWIDAEITAEDVRFLRWEKFDVGELANGDHLSIQQPTFNSMKDTLTLRLQSGQKVLLGVHKTPGAEKTFEMFFLQIATMPAAPSN